MIIARALLVCLPLVLLLTQTTPRAQTELGVEHDGAPEAAACIDRFHAVLLEVMKNAESLGYSGRMDMLEPAVKNAYNLPFMARKSVGRHWKDLSEADRAQFLGLFTDLTVSNYAGRFTGWGGEEFETLGTDPGVHETMLVKSRIVRPDDDDVTLDYRLHRTPDDGWRIIDVYMDGTISELALRRSEYSAVLRREGFPALVEALDRKIADLAEG